MARKRIIALEGDPERAALLRRLLEATGNYEILVSKSALALMEQMDGRGLVQLVITNTRVTTDERDGLKFIKALHLKYQTFPTALPPIIVCSADQSGQVVQNYAFRFSELPLVYYVLIRTEELERDPSRLLSVVEQSLARRLELEASIPDDPVAHVKGSLRNLLRSTVALPKVPDVASRVQDALRDPEITFRKLARVISTDLTLGANVVRMANSPIYGVSGKISTLEDACKQLGLNGIANLVVATKVFEALESMPVQYDMRRLRRHSLAVATIARVLGRRCHSLGDVRLQMEFSGTMFAAGLLHDIGKALIAHFFPEEAERVAGVIAEQGCPTLQAETQVLGVSHAEAGLLAAIEWAFPVILINVIGGHHVVLDGILARLKTRQGRLAQRVIRIADAASYEMDFGMAAYGQQPPVLDPALFAHTGVNPEEFAGWTREVKNDILYTFESLGRA
ncbi:MAG: HDOD domain-containing protein [Candidatus Latescibacterota bacterium]